MNADAHRDMKDGAASGPSRSDAKDAGHRETRMPGGGSPFESRRRESRGGVGLTDAQERAEARESAARGRTARRLLHEHGFWLGTVLLAGLVGFAFLGPHLYHQSPYAINANLSLAGPGRGRPLGSDVLGRNELARLMLGGQAFLLIGCFSAIIAVGVGIVVGLVGALGEGTAPSLLMWFSDTVLNIPQVVPLLLFEVLLVPNVLTFVIVIGGTGWPSVARMVRAAALEAGARDYVEAARAQGASGPRIYFRHVLPNIRGTLLTAASQQANQGVLVLATVSFLAFGLPPPLPNWANMIANSFGSIQSGAWWLVIPPGVAFVLLQIGVNLTADGLHRALEVRTGERVR